MSTLEIVEERELDVTGVPDSTGVTDLVGEASDPLAKSKPKESPEFRLEFSREGQLTHYQKNKGTRVYPRRCFPWSEPLRYFSLRDKEEKEVALISDLSELDENSRKAMVLSLEEAGFCFIVTDLLDIEDEYELRQWKVQTNQGARCFQTNLADWPREVPGGGLLIQDVHGDVYLIPDLEALPEPGKKKLWTYLDD